MNKAPDLEGFCCKECNAESSSTEKYKSLPKENTSEREKNTQTHQLPNNGVAVQATSPGRVPGSKSVYEKQIDAAGKTIQYTKITYDTQGNIIHVKDKLNGGVSP